MHQLIYTEKAKNDLKELEKKVAKRVLDKLEFYASQEDPLSFAKRLQNNAFGSYRFRIGDYRVIFDNDSKGNIKILFILSVKHRREAYRDI